VTQTGIQGIQFPDDKNRDGFSSVGLFTILPPDPDAGWRKFY
jgi:hypothetical protein